MNTQILTVNDFDRVTGIADKNEVHAQGLLHRAFSLFVYNSENEMLLQQRAPGKYHSGGLWTNTCCSHALTGLSLEDTVHGRLLQEMGFDCPVKELFTVKYTAALDNGLVENEIDHIFTGVFDGNPSPDPTEVSGWKWVSQNEVSRLLEQNPRDFTEWFKIIFPELVRAKAE